MTRTAAARSATQDRDAGRYQRHRPEQTLLYRIIEQRHPAFTAQLAAQGRVLPGYVQREFVGYLKGGRREQGFLQARCESCHAEHLVVFHCKRSGTRRRRRPGKARRPERRASITWAQRLRRVIHIDIETYQACGGAVRVIAGSGDPAVIQRTLDHLKDKAETSQTAPPPESPAPPMGLFTG